MAGSVRARAGWGAILAIAVVLVATAGTVLAQQAPSASGGRTTASALLELVPHVTPDEAVASPFGRKLISLLGEHWRSNADVGCLAEKSLDAKSFATLAREVTLAVGRRLQSTVLGRFDAAAAEVEFKKTAGEGALSEMRSLAASRDAGRYLELLREASAGDLMLGTIAAIEGAIRMARLGVVGETHPATTGNGELLDEFTQLGARASRFLQEHRSRDVGRLDELMSALTEAIVKAFDDKTASEVDGAGVMDVVVPMLTAHCIAKL
jgi:hypothetical protein